MNSKLRALLCEELGEGLEDYRSLAGGDICQAYQLLTESGRKLFLKTRAQAPPNMFSAEARGLDWLRETEALRIPEVIAHKKEFLLLEFLDSASPVTNFDELLGQGLAKLHQYPEDEFGLDHSNFIGPLTQENSPLPNWSEFYAQNRLQVRLDEAIKMGRAPVDWQQRFQRLYERLPSLIPEEKPSRLHGDLWAGNLHTGPQGQPCLIDPAVYVGHREVDLAMMRLFGGFSERVFAAYDECYPWTNGVRERVDLFQLYPLLVHVVLFGGSYVHSVDNILRKYT